MYNIDVQRHRKSNSIWDLPATTSKHIRRSKTHHKNHKKKALELAPIPLARQFKERQRVLAKSAAEADMQLELRQQRALHLAKDGTLHNNRFDESSSIGLRLKGLASNSKLKVKRNKTRTAATAAVGTVGENKNTGKDGMVWGANPMNKIILPPPPTLPPPPSFWGSNTNTNPMFKGALPPPPPSLPGPPPMPFPVPSKNHQNKARSRWNKVFKQNKVARGFQKNRNKQQENTQDLPLEMVDVELEMVELEMVDLERVELEKVEMMDSGSTSREVYVLSAETNDITGPYTIEDVKYRYSNGDMKFDALISIDASDWIFIGEYIAGETVETENPPEEMIDVKPVKMLVTTERTNQLSALKVMTRSSNDPTKKQTFKKQRGRGQGKRVTVKKNISTAVQPNEIEIEIEKFEVMEMIPTLKKTKVLSKHKNESPAVLCTSDYEAADISEISMIKGDKITVVKHEDENWSKGKNQRTGELGLFPREYVERFLKDSSKKV